MGKSQGSPEICRILNQRVAELEGKVRDLEQQAEQQQTEAATRESALQAKVDKLSRDVDDARDEYLKNHHAWVTSEAKLKASIVDLEKEQDEIIRCRFTNFK
jgi:ribosomal protein L9